MSWPASHSPGTFSRLASSPSAPCRCPTPAVACCPTSGGHNRVLATPDCASGMGVRHMASTRSVGSWPHRPDLTLAILGLASGAVSAGLGTSNPSSFEWAQPLATALGLTLEALPVLLIGFSFGLAMAAGIWLHTGKLWAAPVVVVSTMCAWGAAIQIAIRLQRTADDAPHLIAAGLAAGTVGAGITHLGSAI